jgi:hypothetical protein
MLRDPKRSLSDAVYGDGKRKVENVERSVVALLFKHGYWRIYPIDVLDFLFDAVAHGAFVVMLVAYALVGERTFTVKYVTKSMYSVEKTFDPIRTAGLCLLEASKRNRFDIIEFYIKILGSKSLALQSVRLVLEENCIPWYFGNLVNPSAVYTSIEQKVETYKDPSLFDIIFQKLKILEVKEYITPIQDN